MNSRKIFALTPEDPAFENGARYAVCEPAWSEWSVAWENTAMVVVAYAKCANLDDARKYAAGCGILSTYPGGLSADFSLEFK